MAGQVGRGYGNGRVHVLASWAGGTLPRRPTGGFDKGLLEPGVCACHLAETERRRQAVPNGGG
ncbi:hypothetical protein ALQ40_101251 [Pseudomonas syringae]|nr:hypothetical protein ALO85_101247 [Pseudomonas syringae pv. aptata]RMO45740.1 hypothetical protein ALQ40_101251 [Pseudomonas syringae]